MARLGRRSLLVLLVVGLCLFAAQAAFGAQYLQGGDFEGGTELPGGEGSIEHPAWVEQDNLFTSPICGPGCVVLPAPVAPRTGSNWVWFGGSAEEQSQSVYRIETFAAGPVTAVLSFYVWVGQFANESGSFRARFDGVPVFKIDETNQSDYSGGYTRVVVPLEDPVPGTPHQVLFEYDGDASPGNITSISLDDVSVETTYLRDGDFEAAVAPNPFKPMYLDSPGWTESANDGFDSPICETSACGTGLDTREAHGGVQWTYFGFATKASISQVATTPALADASVSFFLVADEFINPNAKVNLKVDGATRFTLDAGNDQLFGGHYRLVTVPLGALPAGGHTVAFDYNLPAGGAASANVDDVTLTGTLAPPPVTPVAQPVPVGPPETQIKKLKLLTAKSKSGAPKLGAKLTFAGSGGSSKLKFQCKLDKAKFKPCASPKTYNGLKPGRHNFQVRAVDATGATDATPAKRSFQIATPKPRTAR